MKCVDLKAAASIVMPVCGLSGCVWCLNTLCEDGMATHLQCPVFKREFMDDPTGNLWPPDRLSPCKLLSVPCHAESPNLVVLSRFASFLDQVPEVQ